MRKRFFPLAIVFLAMNVDPAFAERPQNAQTIIEKSVQANNADWNAEPQYNYFERDREQGGGTKTFEEIMILGSPYERLVKVNGKALSSEEQAEEQKKLDAAIAQRRSESAQQRSQRIAKYEKDRKRNHLLMEQLTKAFDFKLNGEQKLNGHEVYLLTATPRSGYQPPNMEAKVLTGMQGKLWVDKQTYQWVKVEARVIHSVSIEGFVARVEPGTRFELEKVPVTDDIWLPQHFAMKSKAKVFFLFTHHTQEDDSYYGYHKSSDRDANRASN